MKGLSIGRRNTFGLFQTGIPAFSIAELTWEYGNKEPVCLSRSEAMTSRQSSYSGNFAHNATLGFLSS